MPPSGGLWHYNFVYDTAVPDIEFTKKLYIFYKNPRKLVIFEKTFIILVKSMNMGGVDKHSNIMTHICLYWPTLRPDYIIFL